jgi:hypothetical protein
MRADSIDNLIDFVQTTRTVNLDIANPRTFHDYFSRLPLTGNRGFVVLSKAEKSQTIGNFDRSVTASSLIYGMRSADAPQNLGREVIAGVPFYVWEGLTPPQVLRALFRIATDRGHCGGDVSLSPQQKHAVKALFAEVVRKYTRAGRRSVPTESQNPFRLTLPKMEEWMDGPRTALYDPNDLQNPGDYTDATAAYLSAQGAARTFPPSSESNASNSPDQVYAALGVTYLLTIPGSAFPDNLSRYVPSFIAGKKDAFETFDYRNQIACPEARQWYLQSPLPHEEFAGWCLLLYPNGEFHDVVISPSAKANYFPSGSRLSVYDAIPYVALQADPEKLHLPANERPQVPARFDSLQDALGLLAFYPMEKPELGYLRYCYFAADPWTPVLQRLFVGRIHRERAEKALAEHEPFISPSSKGTLSINGNREIAGTPLTGRVVRKVRPGG